MVFFGALFQEREGHHETDITSISIIQMQMILELQKQHRELSNNVVQVRTTHLSENGKMKINASCKQRRM